MSSRVFLDPWRVSSVNSRHSFTAIEPLANKRPESSLSGGNAMSGGNATFRIKNAVAKGNVTIIKACSSSRLSSNTLSQHPFQISTHPNKLSRSPPSSILSQRPSNVVPPHSRSEMSSAYLRQRARR
ncbi:hypothetical protein FRB93_001096 [Tulasnella sp. JGI-2019a]|nr:hypothetical protein FRB93_001096 [Tulasnella sp. JGI-2019a]